MLNRWASRASRASWWGWGVVLLALLLGGALLPNPPVADDHYHRMFFTGSTALAEQGFQTAGAGHSLRVAVQEMFSFFAPSNTNKEVLQALGFFPWWANQTLQVSFWRPLTALTHWIDYTLWPNHPSLMRLHSALWYGGVVGLVWLLFRRLTRRRSIAVVASLVFVLDTTHLETVNWLAARNGLLALACGLLAVIALDLAKGPRRLLWYILSYGAFLGGLLSGEAGVAAFLMIVGYALCCERPASGRAWLAYLPFPLILGLWLGCYYSLGYGVSGSGFYLDPWSQGGEYLGHSLLRIPLLATTALTGGGSFLNLLPVRLQFWLSAGMSVLLAGLWYTTRFRFRSHPGLSWGWFVMLAAVLPVSAATVFSPRLFLFVSVGGALILAHLLIWLADRIESGVSGSLGWGLRFCQSYLIGVHLLGCALVWLLAGGLALMTLVLPARPDSLVPIMRNMAGQRVMVIHSPHSFAMLYLPFMIDQRGEAPPREFHLLLPGYQPFSLTRVDQDTLELASVGGVSIPPVDVAGGAAEIPLGMAGLLRSEKFFRAPAQPLSLGEVVTQAQMRITVLDIAPQSRRIRQIRFESLQPEGFDSMLWYVWDLPTGQYQSVPPLKVGETRHFSGYLTGGQSDEF